MDKRNKADQIVQAHVAWAMGAGLLPVPFLDVAVVTAVQVDMLKQLADTYGVEVKPGDAKLWVSGLAGGVLARIGSRALKLIPGIGMFSMAAMAGASTYAIGQVAINHFEQGGGLTGFDFRRAKKEYTKEYNKGKNVVEHSAADKAAARELFEKLEELRRKKDAGEITQEQFDAERNKLVD